MNRIFVAILGFSGLARAGPQDIAVCPFEDIRTRPVVWAARVPPTRVALHDHADRRETITVKMRDAQKPEQKFDFYTIGSASARKQYLEKVVPRTVAVGFVFGRPEEQSHLSKIHTYIRVGDTVFEIDTPTTKHPEKGTVRKYPAAEFYKTLLERSDAPTFHESVVDAQDGERKDLKAFYEALGNNALDVNGKKVKAKYDLMGMGLAQGNQIDVNCFSLSLLFSLPALTQSYPGAAQFAKRTNHTASDEEQKLGHLLPWSFGSAIKAGDRVGFATFGANVLTEGNPPGQHGANFFDVKKNPLAKKMGVVEIK